MIKLSKLFIVTVLLCGYNFTVFAETLTVETVTEALAYSGEQSTVTKLIITGQIAGDDYSEGSEWREFRTLDETFPNIEAVEILTDQDIPDIYFVDNYYYHALFFEVETDAFGLVLEYYASDWLKSFSAPNVTAIGGFAFAFCINLTSIDFPAATTIGSFAFGECRNLTSINFPVAITIKSEAFAFCANLISINFPLVQTIGGMAFSDCRGLTYANFSFVTDFTEPTTINLGRSVFSFTPTENVDLTLGEYVLPLYDSVNNTWQTTTGDNTGTPYRWKSITIYSNIDEIIKNRTVSIFPNPTVVDFTVSFDLEKSGNLQILLCDILGKEVLQFYDGFASAGNFTRTFNTENLAKGIYFLKIQINGNSTVEKIIVE